MFRTGTHCWCAFLYRRWQRQRVPRSPTHRANRRDGFQLQGDIAYASGHPGPTTPDSFGGPNLGLVRSTDGGRTWSNASLTGQADHHDLAIGPQVRWMAVGAIFGLDTSKQATQTDGLTGALGCCNVDGKQPHIGFVGTIADQDCQGNTLVMVHLNVPGEAGVRACVEISGEPSDTQAAEGVGHAVDQREHHQSINDRDDPSGAKHPCLVRPALLCTGRRALAPCHPSSTPQ